MSLIKPTVHLCIPQLLQPLVLWKNDFQFEVEAPELTLLLRQFTINKNTPTQGLDASLFNALGMEGGQELPVAYYRYQTHNNAPPNKVLLCADPIHLEVGMNDITLTEKITDLTKDEAEEILKALNKHFQQDGLEFIYGSNEHWYIALAEDETIETTPPSEVLRKNIAKYQPRSTSKKQQTINWQVIQNESQMILHGCAVNQQREMAGLPTVNSLWFWGGGQVLQSNNSSDVVSVYYNGNSGISAKVIAKVANCDVHLLNDVFSEFKIGKTLIILDPLFSPAVNDHLDLFQQELSKLDEQIIKPLRQEWQSGNIELLVDGCDGNILKPIKPKAWKFWGQKPALLSEVATQ